MYSGAIFNTVRNKAGRKLPSELLLKKEEPYLTFSVKKIRLMNLINYSSFYMFKILVEFS